MIVLETKLQVMDGDPLALVGQFEMKLVDGLFVNLLSEQKLFIFDHGQFDGIILFGQLHFGDIDFDFILGIFDRSCLCKWFGCQTGIEAARLPTCGSSCNIRLDSVQPKQGRKVNIALNEP
jgi:hypothetical protein